MAAASQAGIRGAPAVGAWQSSTPPSHEAMRSEPATATPTQGGRSRGGALAMRSVASAISQMFEREVRTFCTFCRALEAQEARVDQTRRWPCMPLPPHTPICCLPVGISRSDARFSPVSRRAACSLRPPRTAAYPAPAAELSSKELAAAAVALPSDRQARGRAALRVPRAPRAPRVRTAVVPLLPYAFEI